MHLTRKTVYDDLYEKGISNLYHANSVLTACQFLKTNSLLSRGTLERYGYNQTEQESDAKDKTYSLWFDVFTDTVDIHNRASIRNVYGPVLFVIDPDIITEQATGRIWVTKVNPINWRGLSEEERWFQSKTDLKANLKKGTFDQMIVFRHCGGSLPLEGYLKKIILDDPGVKFRGNIDPYSMALGALALAMDEAGIRVPIEKRACGAACRCKTQYAAMNRADVKKMYIPMFEK